MVNKLYIGVDGGGSKTRFLMMDENENTIATAETDSTNKNSVGNDNAKKHLFDGFTILKQHELFCDNSLKGICAGMSGVSQEK